MEHQNRIKGRFDSRLTRRDIDLMLNLRLNGWSHNSLGSFFGIDRTTARDQCEKYGIYYLDRGIGLPAFHDYMVKWEYRDGEKINKGKSYADYLNDIGYRPPSKR